MSNIAVMNPTISVSSKNKQKLLSIFSNYGLTEDEGFEYVVNQIAEKNEVSFKDEKREEPLEESIKEGMRLAYDKNAKTYNSADELFKDILGRCIK